MKILLVNPGDISYRYKSGLFSKPISYAPLTLTLLAALIPEELSASIRIIDEGVDGTKIDYNIDLLGITVLAANASRAYEIARQAKIRGIYVVFGGSHATLMPEECMAHADTVIIGQGEITWPQFLKDFSQGKPQKIYKEETAIELKSLPYPRRDLLKPRSYLPIDTVQASRGCPYRCDFCAISTQLSARKLQRPVGKVIAEIKTLRKNKLLFLDPNFNADREYSTELMKALKNLHIHWGCLTNADVGGDDQQLSLMRESGCIGVLIGFESICQNTLNRINKGFNRVNQYKTYIKAFHTSKIGVLGCFIFGFDDDEQDIFSRTVDFIFETKIDLPRFAVLTPFPGTRLFQKLQQQNRITINNWDYYDFQHVVFQPKHLSINELTNGLLWSWKEVYKWKPIIKRITSLPFSLILAGTLANFSFRNYGYKLQ